MGHTGATASVASPVTTRHIWYVIAAMAAATAVACALTGVRPDVTSHPMLLLPFGVLGLTMWVYSRVRPDQRLRNFAETCMQLLLVLLLGTILSYAAAATSIPLKDDALHAIDQALGLDRKVYIAFFDSKAWLYNTVTLAYFTFMPQFVVVLLVLFAAKQPRRLQQFVFATGLALFATDLISTLTPSLTSIYLDLGLRVGAEIPAHRYTPLPTMNALRSGLPYSIDLSAVEGLISFPSFHTIGAILFVWALWPVYIVRWFALALNAALIAATPFIGAHYFIDIAGGVVVACTAIAIVRRLTPN